MFRKKGIRMGEAIRKGTLKASSFKILISSIENVTPAKATC